MTKDDMEEAQRLCDEYKHLKVPLRVGVSKTDGRIIDVGPCRHRVDWVGSGPSSVTYCNACGGSFVIGDECAKCGAPATRLETV